MTETGITLADIQDASRLINIHVLHRKIRESTRLNGTLGFRLLIKDETSQPTGSFKVRGAFNQLLRLTGKERAKGVVAISSGNHAQAVAYAAHALGIEACILMPEDAPKLKLERTRSYGATVMTYDRATQDRETLGGDLSRKRGARLIHPYNDLRTVAGQGTVGLEIFHQTKNRGITPDALVVPCSGGGLAAGIALTRDLYNNPPDIFTAEPFEFNDMQKSLYEGESQTNHNIAGSICDALMASSPGTNTLPVLLQHAGQGLAAKDEDIQGAMWIASLYFGLRLEPGGAAALACACLNRKQFKGKTVVVVASGGNVDEAAYDRMLCHGRARAAGLVMAHPS